MTRSQKISTAVQTALVAPVLVAFALTAVSHLEPTRCHHDQGVCSQAYTDYLTGMDEGRLEFALEMQASPGIRVGL